MTGLAVLRHREEPSEMLPTCRAASTAWAAMVPSGAVVEVEVVVLIVEIPTVGLDTTIKATPLYQTLPDPSV